MHISYNKLRELTGKSYRTLKKRLEGLEPVKTGSYNALLFDSKTALPLIYEVGKNGDLNPVAEKARLDAARADAQELKNSEIKGDLVSASETARIWSNYLVDARNKLLAIPSKVAPVVAEMDDTAEVMEEIRKYIHEVLEDLANRGESGKYVES